MAGPFRARLTGWVTSGAAPATIGVVSAADHPPRQVSDEKLVLQARTGDKTAFAVFFERHRPTAAALVSRLLDRREDVDDVLQETAVQALVCLDRLRAEDRFDPWLCGIALNLARRQFSARARQARRPPDIAPPQSTLRPLGRARDGGPGAGPSPPFSRANEKPSSCST